MVAVDYDMSAKDQFRGRYFYSNSTGIDFNAQLPVFYVPQPAVNYAGTFSEFHNFSPTLENELRVSFHRYNQNISGGGFSFPGLDAFPNISFDDLQLNIGPDPNTPTGADLEQSRYPGQSHQDLGTPHVQGRLRVSRHDPDRNLRPTRAWRLRLRQLGAIPDRLLAHRRSAGRRGGRTQRGRQQWRAVRFPGQLGVL